MLKEYAAHFQEMKLKYSKPSGRSSPTGSMTSHTSTASADEDPVVEELLLVRKLKNTVVPVLVIPLITCMYVLRV